VEVNAMAVVGEDVPRPVVVGGASWVLGLEKIRKGMKTLNNLSRVGIVIT
jgi:hypothetical protein